ncbi:ribosome assembly RNA-binding protein YhbY [Brachymonas sp. G13]|uniref:ribosome assembly RNA-binding protein YhbY n=1 Tax=Brachymonas TaxID=28219 RepID=UPI001696489B|nr:ribosome assembly RNA-binding protein YhbY [Brachymonas sp. J145]MEE1653060.1 ribosome assembly RNA-binding protein YhbY [Brachymonas sp. J145]NLX16213.1 ribosome assembly RNA-binding protein YhbY [Ramlibacter sp.]
MPQIVLTTQQRKVHRAEAHHLSPVVMIGADGLSEAVLREADAALNAHGLIKIRVLGDDREAREQMYQQIADQLNAAPIQHIGKLFVLWRPIPEKEREIDEDRMPGPRDIKVIKNSSRGGQRPQVRTVRVLGNQRLTAGGILKRAKKRQVSPKKRQGD